MLAPLLDIAPDTAIPVTPLRRAGLEGWLATAPADQAAWVRSVGFTAAPGAMALLPGAGGGLGRVLVGVGERIDLWSLAGCPMQLPIGTYRVEGLADAREATAVATGWALGGYQFTRYKKPSRDPAALVMPLGADRAAVQRLITATKLVRDLVNTPAEDMGPSELAAAATALAGEFGATLTVIEGDELLSANYPMIHAVGRASTRAPRLIDLSWGREGDPLLVLVGKGVCFDSGGLDIKPAAGMMMMKKDMGGAAHALALSRMVMQAGVRVRLRMLVPAVENAISGNAFRPMDIIPTRKGLSVEIGNTDAEGRLILCDALAEGDAGKPALMIDFATLTGAARVALGAELPALFSNDDGLAAELLDAAKATDDPMWRMPLWQGYRSQLDSKIADLNNAPGGGMAGAITAALFLEQFVSATTPWAHFDLYSWNGSGRPGRPEGGEAMTLRAVFAVLEKRFGVG